MADPATPSTPERCMHVRARTGGRISENLGANERVFGGAACSPRDILSGLVRPPHEFRVRTLPSLQRRPCCCLRAWPQVLTARSTLPSLATHAEAGGEAGCVHAAAGEPCWAAAQRRRDAW